jgi:hypothetical protein
MKNERIETLALEKKSKDAIPSFVGLSSFSGFTESESLGKYTQNFS